MVLDALTDNPVGQGTQVLLDILSELDVRTEPVSIAELEEILRGLTLDRANVAPWVQFDGKIYRRNLIRQSTNYTALLLCWRCGQRTPIHNHKGSACAVKVIHGIASEIHFEHGPNDMVYPTGSRHYQSGEVFSSFDVDTHQMVNLQADPHDLITLHVYSPPLKEMEFVAMQETTLANHDADLLGPVMAYWRKDVPPISTLADDGGRVSVVIVGGGCSGSLTAIGSESTVGRGQGILDCQLSRLDSESKWHRNTPDARLLWRLALQFFCFFLCLLSLTLLLAFAILLPPFTIFV